MNFMHTFMYMYMYTCTCKLFQGMDIPDIELVIMYGALSSVNQLHQVVFIHGNHAYVCTVVFWREARAHIFYSTHKWCKIDAAVQLICVDTQTVGDKKCWKLLGVTKQLEEASIEELGPDGDYEGCTSDSVEELESAEAEVGEVEIDRQRYDIADETDSVKEPEDDNHDQDVEEQDGMGDEIDFVEEPGDDSGDQ